MNIEITKGIDRKKVDLIYSCVDFFGKLLIHGNSRRIINITVNELARKDKQDGFLGFAEWDIDYIRPRDFIISVHSRRSKALVIETIAHEMVHVKQFVKGDMKHRDWPCNKTSLVVLWKNEHIDLDKVPYHELPWEIEAAKLEKVLADEYRKYYADF